MAINLAKKLRLEKFSNLETELVDIESEHAVGEPGRVKASRSALLRAFGRYKAHRYGFGRALANYKEILPEEEGWIAATTAMAQVLGCHERTIRNILREYIETSSLPKEIFVAALEAKLDLTSKKNKPIRNNLLAMPSDVLTSHPKKAIALAAEAAKKPVRSVGDGLSLTKEDRLNWEIRLKIRICLSNVPDRAKLKTLMASLEEEMFEVWGMDQDIAITLHPHPSSLGLDGRRKSTERTA